MLLTPTPRRGSVWLLLLCLDSQSRAVVASLLGVGVRPESEPEATDGPEPGTLDSVQLSLVTWAKLARLFTKLREKDDILLPPWMETLSQFCWMFYRWWYKCIHIFTFESFFSIFTVTLHFSPLPSQTHHERRDHRDITCPQATKLKDKSKIEKLWKWAYMSLKWFVLHLDSITLLCF